MHLRIKLKNGNHLRLEAVKMDVPAEINKISRYMNVPIAGKMAAILQSALIFYLLYRKCYTGEILWRCSNRHVPGVLRRRSGELLLEILSSSSRTFQRISSCPVAQVEKRDGVGYNVATTRRLRRR